MNAKHLALSAVLIFGVGTTYAATDSAVAFTLAEGEDIQTVAGQTLQIPD
jgi:hypothetical protein